MSPIDILIVLLYFCTVLVIAIKARRFVKDNLRKGRSNAIETQYLAGRTLTYHEALFSILAADISAFNFLILPGIVFRNNFSPLQMMLGVFISRHFISRKILIHIHGKGLTIFDALARGIHNYTNIRRLDELGKKLLASLYLFFKMLEVAFKLYLGCLFISEMVGVSANFTMMVLCMFTYVYVVIGGLKAVVRTDIMQFFIFIWAAVICHLLIAYSSDSSWFTLVGHAAKASKFSLIDGRGLWGLLIGFVCGIIYDVATHGCDQEIAQKLFAIKDLSLARKALRNSAPIMFATNVLFLSLGAVLWSLADLQGVTFNNTGAGAFYDFLQTRLPSPVRGLIIAGVLAAVMSSLDSAINALSATYWNDIMPHKETKEVGLYIKLDMLIITQIILFMACMINSFPRFTNATHSAASWTMAPLVSLVLMRIGFHKYIKIDFNPGLILVCYGSSFFALIVSKIYLKAELNFAVIFSVICSCIGVKIYSIINKKLNFETTE